LSRFRKFAELGRVLAAEWGINSTDETADNTIKKWFERGDIRLTVALLSAVTSDLQALKNEIANLPANMAKSQRREEILLEKEKQKTAKAQQKAAEAMPQPVTLTMISMSPEQIAEAVDNRRVLRRF